MWTKWPFRSLACSSCGACTRLAQNKAPQVPSWMPNGLTHNVPLLPEEFWQGQADGVVRINFLHVSELSYAANVQVGTYIKNTGRTHWVMKIGHAMWRKRHWGRYLGAVGEELDMWVVWNNGLYLVYYILNIHWLDSSQTGNIGRINKTGSRGSSMRIGEFWEG